jgi:hypothetical protein
MDISPTFLFTITNLRFRNLQERQYKYMKLRMANRMVCNGKADDPGLIKRNIRTRVVRMSRITLPFLTICLHTRFYQVAHGPTLAVPPIFVFQSHAFLYDETYQLYIDDLIGGDLWLASKCSSADQEP